MPNWLGLIVLGLMLIVVVGFFALMFSQMASKREHASRPDHPRRSGNGSGKPRSTKTRKRHSR